MAPDGPVSSCEPRGRIAQGWCDRRGLHCAMAQTLVIVPLLPSVRSASFRGMFRAGSEWDLSDQHSQAAQHRGGEHQ